jgi:hypothetical protein
MFLCIYRLLIFTYIPTCTYTSLSIIVVICITFVLYLMYHSRIVVWANKLIWFCFVYKENALEMLLRTIYERNQTNLMVNFKRNSAKRHPCASSNICRMPHMVTVSSVDRPQKLYVHEEYVFVPANKACNNTVIFVRPTITM